MCVFFFVNFIFLSNNIYDKKTFSVLIDLIMVGAESVITEIISNLKLKLNILQNKCHFKFICFVMSLSEYRVFSFSIF